MGQLTFLLGGARSGKSTHAERLARQIGGNATYIATAEALDPEMADRIAAHQRKRPEDWRTLEIPRRIAAVLEKAPPRSQVIILDCLTLLVTNILLAVSPEEDEPEEAVAFNLVKGELEALLAFIERHEAHWILVSNEVGLGLVPPYPLGRVYRDLLGWANQQVAARANEVLWMVAGIPLPIHQHRISGR
jgi:adenosylcobinamide kinase/adenosylcobinamide-phosphate guanylyltransferase